MARQRTDEGARRRARWTRWIILGVGPRRHVRRRAPPTRRREGRGRSGGRGRPLPLRGRRDAVLAPFRRRVHPPGRGQLADLAGRRDRRHAAVPALFCGQICLLGRCRAVRRPRPPPLRAAGAPGAPHPRPRRALLKLRRPRRLRSLEAGRLPSWSYVRTTRGRPGRTHLDELLAKLRHRLRRALRLAAGSSSTTASSGSTSAPWAPSSACSPGSACLACGVSPSTCTDCGACDRARFMDIEVSRLETCTCDRVRRLQRVRRRPPGQGRPPGRGPGGQARVGARGHRRGRRRDGGRGRRGHRGRGSSTGGSRGWRRRWGESRLLG